MQQDTLPSTKTRQRFWEFRKNPLIINLFAQLHTHTNTSRSSVLRRQRELFNFNLKIKGRLSEAEAETRRRVRPFGSNDDSVWASLPPQGATVMIRDVASNRTNPSHQRQAAGNIKKKPERLTASKLSVFSKAPARLFLPRTFALFLSVHLIW